jgi:hypothetical protein
MAVENVEELRPEVEGCGFAYEMDLLTQREILVPASERTRAG